MFTHAIVRTPAENFADGITSFRGDPPDYAKALGQHEAYCRALERCGLQLTVLGPDLRHPDSTFVEDVAVLVRGRAILSRPGAPGRQGEVATIRPTLERFFTSIDEIAAPGTLDGGDICETDGHFFIGVSHRTNEAGARQLENWLSADGFSSTCVDIRESRGTLHLKSGLAWLGNGHLAATEELADRQEFRAYSVMRVAAGETYAANCVRVNDSVLIPTGYPLIKQSLEKLGLRVMALDVSEFQKMDGGLSCLSLRF